jgi:hypothetical protein
MTGGVTEVVLMTMSVGARKWLWVMQDRSREWLAGGSEGGKDQARGIPKADRVWASDADAKRGPREEDAVDGMSMVGGRGKSRGDIEA